jgi:hypothetical protein
MERYMHDLRPAGDSRRDPHDLTQADRRVRLELPAVEERIGNVGALMTATRTEANQ